VVCTPSSRTRSFPTSPCGMFTYKFAEPTTRLLEHTWPARAGLPPNAFLVDWRLIAIALRRVQGTIRISRRRVGWASLCEDREDEGLEQ
jgi:hypothetical protein